MSNPPTYGASTSAMVGGGFGGATCARFMKRMLPQASVTLVEPNTTYLACPFSNLVVVGQRDLSAQAFGYAALAADEPAKNLLPDGSTGGSLAQQKAFIMRGEGAVIRSHETGARVSVPVGH